MNSQARLKTLAAEHGFEVVFMDAIEVRPNYLAFSAPTFLLGTVYERLVNSMDAFSAMRANIVTVFRKLE